jgi:hypothetical protein
MGYSGQGQSRGLSDEEIVFFSHPVLMLKALCRCSDWPIKATFQPAEYVV